ERGGDGRAEGSGEVAVGRAAGPPDPYVGKDRAMTRSTLQDDPTLLVHAYLDGELDPINALAVEQRLASDPALAAEYERVRALQQVIRERLPREAPPPDLRARVEAAVRPPRSRWQPSGHPSWRALAASILVTAFVAGGSTWMALAPQSA